MFPVNQTIAEWILTFNNNNDKNNIVDVGNFKSYIYITLYRRANTEQFDRVFTESVNLELIKRNQYSGCFKLARVGYILKQIQHMCNTQMLLN